MKSRFFWMLASLFAINSIHTTVDAAYTIKNGGFVHVDEVCTKSVEEHFAMGARAIRDDEWEEAAYQFRIISANFPNILYGQEALYYLGISYYYIGEYDYANEALTAYLKCAGSPRYFQETIEYKFAIAQKLGSGEKRRFFGTKHLPKWACGKDMALEIYDEVIAAVPCHSIAGEALIAKAYLLWNMRDYRGAIEAFQLVIRRFIKHELAPECYVLISKVYLEQSYYEHQNPDILAFAQINLSRFEKEFPREERLCEVQNDVLAIKEIYARGLYDTGRFYERTCHPRAAVIYYHNAIHQFPDTCVSDLCRDRLVCLDETYTEPVEGEDDESEESWQEQLEQLEPRSEGVLEHMQELEGS